MREKRMSRHRSMNKKFLSTTWRAQGQTMTMTKHFRQLWRHLLGFRLLLVLQKWCGRPQGLQMTLLRWTQQQPQFLVVTMILTSTNRPGCRGGADGTAPTIDDLCPGSGDASGITLGTLLHLAEKRDTIGRSAPRSNAAKPVPPGPPGGNLLQGSG